MIRKWNALQNYWTRTYPSEDMKKQWRAGVFGPFLVLQQFLAILVTLAQFVALSMVFFTFILSKSQFLSYFEKIAHMSVVWAYVSLQLRIFVNLYVCISVCLDVWMFVARANKVKGTDIAKGRTRALWDRYLDSSQFFCLFLRLQVFENITLNVFMVKTLCTVMQLFKRSYFSVDAISRHLWPNSAIENGTDIHIYELCFTRFKVEYKRSCIFKALPVKQELIFRYGLSFESMRPITCGFTSLKGSFFLKLTEYC